MKSGRRFACKAKLFALGTVSVMCVGMGDLVVTSASAQASTAAPAPEAHAGPRWTQMAMYTDPSNLAGTYGYSEAVSGSTMVVGASNDGANGAGLVYVYSGSGSTWTLEATLSPPGGGVQGQNYGNSVAIDSSGYIAVGSFDYSTNSAFEEGEAFVYHGSGSSWSLQATLSDPGNAADDYFGNSVAFSGPELFVGAAGENSFEGEVFAYVPVSGGWSIVQAIPEPGGSAGDDAGFGIAIAISGPTLVVGALTADGTLPANMGENGTGAVFVFTETRLVVTWVERAELVASNGRGCVTTCNPSYPFAEGGDFFGDAVAIKGHTVVVGAQTASIPPITDSGDSAATSAPGTAYIFSGSGSDWTENAEVYDLAELTADQQPCMMTGFPYCDDWFGTSVAVLTSHTIAVSAPYDFDGDAVGAAFVFNKHGHSWPTSPTVLKASNGAPGDYFGFGSLVSIGTDYLAVGAPYAADGTLYFFKSSGRS